MPDAERVRCGVTCTTAIRRPIEGPPPAHAVPLFDLLRQVAQRHGAKPGQIAMAWVQQRAVDWGIPVVPIPGTVRIAHLGENVAAGGLALSAEELAELEARTPAPVP